MQNIDIGFSELSQSIYVGKSKKKGNHAEWIGEKKDITSRFLEVMEQKFPINTTQVISINGENKYRVIIVDMEKEVVINGKKI